MSPQFTPHYPGKRDTENGISVFVLNKQLKCYRKLFVWSAHCNKNLDEPPGGWVGCGLCALASPDSVRGRSPSCCTFTQNFAGKFVLPCKGFQLDKRGNNKNACFMRVSALSATVSVVL